MEQQATEEKIKKVAQMIGDRFHPLKVILFGSWAWGSPHEDSDVDLAVVADTDDTRRLARDIDGFIFPRPFPLDVLVYRPDAIAQKHAAGDYFVSDLLEKGKTLYVAG